MNHKELTMWILLELDAAGSIDYLVTQRRCGFARDDRLGVNRGRFFSFWAASLRHLAAALSFRCGAMAISQRRRLRRWDYPPVLPHFLELW